MSEEYVEVSTCCGAEVIIEEYLLEDGDVSLSYLCSECDACLNNNQIESKKVLKEPEHSSFSLTVPPVMSVDPENSRFTKFINFFKARRN